ncbi:Protein kinase domain containing protein [Coccidioides posadasii C735 delta SOWgp]|uniref:Protein kinase domain containing protein n=1 Tax=Coccidioides posadasii (strain C735) TaxID=222929 RepID=C5P7I1_COCP7|nr:Protein kinase domain containing protein [Coccidioides posadasii C735 delta SOWgp]EER27381.1 Protein kinase domain containing protein [Coccidioides posadasii C735 delta SOWgp]|eukprot:XP_003069526.1 Protein kinase domain containing protein [Coccidioides posadasii C735 delta SOWgp]
MSAQSMNGARKKKSRGVSELAAAIDILAGNPLLIGRSPKLCQVVVNDPRVSKKHLRIYAIVFDQDNPDHIAPLVYAQDISLNGTLWNGRRISRRTGSVLLSDGDTFELCEHVIFTFTATKQGQDVLSTAQLKEAKVRYSMCQLIDVYADMSKEFRHEYSITDRMLGSGAYGQVCMAINQRDGTQLACKVVDLSAMKAQLRAPGNARAGNSPLPAANIDPYQQILEMKKCVARQQLTRKIESRLKVYDREVEILQKLRHPNIIGIKRVFKTENTLYIFQDLIPAGDLFSFLEFKGWRLHDTEAAVIVRQIVIALDYLHNNNIVHRDLKPDNILMTSLRSDCRVVLTDFGCARYIPREASRMVSIMGTFEYTAPEIDRSKPCATKGYTKSVDLWSLGCVTVVLLTGGSPFQHPDTQLYSRKLAQECNLDSLERIEEWSHVGRRAKNFVKRLLILDENMRMTTKDALTHEWFTNPSHKQAFEEIYKKAVSDWKPRPNGEYPLHDFHHVDGQSQTERGPDKRLSPRNTLDPEIHLSLGQTGYAHPKADESESQKASKSLRGRCISITLSDPGYKSKHSLQHLGSASDDEGPDDGEEPKHRIVRQGRKASSDQKFNSDIHLSKDAVDISPAPRHDDTATYTPKQSVSFVRLPFSPAAWSKAADSSDLTQLRQTMALTNKIRAVKFGDCSAPRRSILKPVPPIKGLLRGSVGQPSVRSSTGKKKRHAHIFDLEDDEDINHPLSKKARRGRHSNS